MTRAACKKRMNRAYTYENWAFAGHSMRLCSIRRTHYCSLENGISSWVKVQGGICNAGEPDGASATTQTGTSRIPGPWLEQNIPKGVTRDCMRAA